MAENEQRDESGTRPPEVDQADSFKVAQEKAGETCLSSDELGDLAAGLFDPYQKEQALAHFKNCKKCYDAYVGISFAIASVNRSEPSSKRVLVTVRNLTYAGAALAVIAIIVVFLNIREVQHKIQMESPTVSGNGQKPQPAALPPKKPPRSAQNVAGSKTPRINGEQNKQVEEGSGGVSSVTSGAASGLGNQQASGWLIRVGKICADSDLIHPQLLSSLYREGTALPLEGLPKSKKVLVQRLLHLLSGTQVNDPAEQCVGVRRLLAQEGQ